MVCGLLTARGNTCLHHKQDDKHRVRPLTGWRRERCLLEWLPCRVVCRETTAPPIILGSWNTSSSVKNWAKEMTREQPSHLEGSESVHTRLTSLHRQCLFHWGHLCSQVLVPHSHFSCQVPPETQFSSQRSRRIIKSVKTPPSDSPQL